MRDFNKQILDAWEHTQLNEGKDQVTCLLKESMRSLKFGYPVTNAEELDEAVKRALQIAK
jgi:hypothetical protein